MADKHKVRIRVDVDNYQNWRDKNEGYDPDSTENLCDASSPYNVKPTPLVLDDMYEKLEGLYYGGYLKGRQRQIVALLFNGVTSQTEIAKQLNMKQSNVAVELRKIGKKIS